MWKKLIAVSVLLSVFGGVCTTFAYEVPQNIKVGLYFGNASKDSFSASVNGNIRIGHVYDHTFYPQMVISGADVVVEKGGGAYLRSTNPYDTLEAAVLKAKELRDAGVYAYGGYIDGVNYVMTGIYASAEEAASSVGDLAFTGLSFTPVSLDTKAVMVSAADCNIVFRHDAEIFAFGSASGSTVSVLGGNYYGYIMADRIHANGIAVVNLVSADDYVACVVGSEMYASWPIEALKAQAVIARTYAMTVSSYDQYGIDVTDDTRTQAYKGTSAETDATRRAAAETSGKVVLYNGKPAQTFFGASSGGKTADVYSAWGGGAGLDYLQSVEDPYEDSENVAVWSVTYTADEVAQRLANAGVNIGRVTNIAVLERGEKDERVRKLRFDGTEGSHTVTFETCRTILGLKSQYYYIREENGGGDGGSVSAPVLTADGTASVKLNGAAVLGENAAGTVGNGVTVLGSGGSTYIDTAPVQTNTPKDSFTFDGRGHGHGIGLSQYGAKGMAEAGFTYDQILAHYYVGTTLSN